MHRGIARIHHARFPISKLLVIALLFTWLPTVHSQGLEFFISFAKYLNRLYNAPAPPPSAQTNLALAAFSGNIGQYGQPGTPHDELGILYLTRSAIGQGFQGGIPKAPDFRLGEAIPNPPGTSLAHQPEINPPEKAFYLSDVPNVIASEPGFVTITWRSADNLPAATNFYYISSLAATRPVRIYWTEQGGVPTGAPAVDTSLGPRLELHHNSMLSADDVWIEGDQLKARNVAGSMVIEYRNRATNGFLGIDVLEVRSYEPVLRPAADVGQYLAPAESDPATNRPVVAKGLSITPPSAYQHNYAGDPLDGAVIAVRPASSGEEIDVCWRRTAAHGLVWPYELDRYPAQWPASFEQDARRIYWTESQDSPTKAPPVTIPLEVVPRVQIFYNPDIPLGYNGTLNRSTNLWTETSGPSTCQLHASHREGRVLLWYDNEPEPGIIGPQLVRVMNYWHDNLLNTNVGDRLQPVQSVGDAVTPLVARRLTDSPPFAYQHETAGSMFGSVFAIRRTTTDVQIEVFWQRTGLAGVVWPYEMDRYQAAWPADLPAKYQLYVRAPVPDQGPGVILTTNFSIMPFQEPLGHASLETEFRTTQPGWSLLKWLAGEEVAFQVVRSVWHTDASFFLLTPNAAPIGSEIAEASHRGPRPGYIHTPEGNRYDWEIYDGNTNDPPAFTTGQIIPVNTGLLEVWWANTNRGVQWWSLVKRYANGWPSSPEQIVIANQAGSGPLSGDNQDYDVYCQNDPAGPGFNPNDEHAFIDQVILYALRNDLGRASTSLPYALLKFRDKGVLPRWHYRVFGVQTGTLAYDLLAGALIQPPTPLASLPPCSESSYVLGPAWRARTGKFYAKAAGNDGGPATIVMRYFYSTLEGFYFPDDYLPNFPTGVPQTNVPPANAHFPWLDMSAGTPRVPRNVSYTITWPDLSDCLFVYETLVGAKPGLPDIGRQMSVEILYDQAVATQSGQIVKLIDPIQERVGTVTLERLPDGMKTAIQGDRQYFTDLPPQLRSRVCYDGAATSRKLKLRGEIVVPAAGEYYLLMNVLTARERDQLLALSADSAFRAAVNNLYAQASSLIEVSPQTAYRVPSLALTAGFASRTGYVTLAFNNSTNLNEVVSVQVIRIGCPIYRGELKVIESDNPFDEKLTLRHSGDFAGRADQFEFEWITLPPENGGAPTAPPESWAPYDKAAGLVDITIQGANLFTLSDNYFRCRYRPLAAPYACGTGWSDWTEPMLAPGWIKRVLAGINPYEQRIKDFKNYSANTIVSMISQAGPRWTGNVPLTLEAANQLGLIEIYETVLRRGMDLSIDGGLSYGPANNALLLAAGRLSDLYMLLGNEAYADASDPTIAYGTDDGVYGAEASTITCFQNQTGSPQTGSLLEEELALLRGRDDTQQPGVQKKPFYNRLVWNFTQGDGEVAYAANYDIRDRVYQDPNTGAVDPSRTDGLISEADAQLDYPQGHGDAWGHYLTALQGYYRLLQNTNFYWVPQSEAVLVGGATIQVDYYDERRFAKAAAAKARTGAEIVNLTYRHAYTEDPSGQYQGYLDSNASRAWGVSQWASRAGQGAYFDWVTANALLPEIYQPGYRITSNTLAQVGAQSEYNLTDQVITNTIAAGAPGITTNILEQMLAISPQPFVGRNSILASLDDAIGITNRWRYEAIILGSAQTTGLPESSYTILESFQGAVYPNVPALELALKLGLGTNVFDLYYAAFIAPYIEVPSGQPTTGLAKIDRGTVPELREIAVNYEEIQQHLDKADAGLNPVGLARNVVPFDISPSEIDAGKTHFEQIYDRAVGSMNNAIAVFNHANNSSQILRRQADSVADFQKQVQDREVDFNSRLIEIFGQPHLEDCGTGKTYAGDYRGPDLYHFAYVDKALLTGEPAPPSRPFPVQFKEFTVQTDGSLIETIHNVSYNLSVEGYEMVKPAGWNQRPVPGEVQRALSDLIQTRLRFERGLTDYDNLVSQIVDQSELLTAQCNLNAYEINVLNESKGEQQKLNLQIEIMRGVELGLRSSGRAAVFTFDALAEMLPTAFGMANDATAPARGALRLSGAILSELANVSADVLSVAQLHQQNAKEIAQAETNIKLTTARSGFAEKQQLAQLEQLVRQEASLRLELYNLQEALQQSAGNYRAALARGNRLLEDRLRFRQQTAAQIHQYRYKDMAFRIFRNDALQKYRAQFDLATMYVYLAAKAYDYETNLREGDPRRAGQEFLTQILRARTIGLIQNGAPVPNTGNGDGGLADAMARMSDTWLKNLKGPLGFNNPSQETGRFSLRYELFRILGGSAGNAVWRETLRQHVVSNLLVMPEFQRYCVPFIDPPYQYLPQEPAIVIPFSTTVTWTENLFGWPTVGGDNNFDVTSFATKIRAAGIWFANYSNLGSGLVNTPRVYLIPVGNDVMRTPRRNSSDTSIIREWKILDQVLPISSAIVPGELSGKDWLPITDTLVGSLAEIRRFGFMLAYHDAGFNQSQVTSSSRLIGRSVWNTRWLLIIPAGSLLSDRQEALTRFIEGPMVGGQRTGNGVTDIKLYFQTYAYPQAF